VDRHADYALLADTRVHDFRTNRTFKLPLGPNTLFFRNSTGALARILENWQTSWIVNLNSGAPVSLAAQSMFYANGTADIVAPFDTKGKVRWQEDRSSGKYFMEGALKQIRDPQCANVSTLQNLRNSCTRNAVANAQTGQVLLQSPLPGTRGNSGQRSVEGPGVWRFDANIAKSVKVSETKTLQFRLDATNVFNHPDPATPILDVNNANFGLITGVNAKSTLHRQFQAQLRFTF